MKKELWQDALNEIDEKFAEEYAGILQKDAEQAVPAPVKKMRRPPKWMGWALAAACLALVMIGGPLTGLFQPKRTENATAAPISTTRSGAETNGKTGGTASAGTVSEPVIQEMPQEAVKDGYSMAPAASIAVEYNLKTSGYYGFYSESLGEHQTYWNTEEYSSIQENGFLSVNTSPFSTFAADVDTASYANLRRMIRKGQDIPADAVRIEELINYFRYNHGQPKEGEPFGVNLELADCPWNSQAKLLLIGLQAKSLDEDALPPSNLVFLIDVSGSMATPEKLPLVQRSFMTLAENLSEDDRVTIITYSSGEKMVLDGVSGNQTSRIMGALEELGAGGSTNGQQALKMAYEAAARHFIPGGNNRIILATDGDFNVGVTSEAELTRFVQEEAKKGIFLSVLGYGMGNYKDNKMEAMADNGNGNYYYPC